MLVNSKLFIIKSQPAAVTALHKSRLQVVIVNFKLVSQIRVHLQTQSAPSLNRSRQTLIALIMALLLC